MSTNQRQAFEDFAADKCPVCGQERMNFNGHNLLPCGRDSAFGTCRDAERLAIERAAEIERLKAAQGKGKWTDRRAFQLASDLCGLLRDCNGLNRATHVIERLVRISMISEELTKPDPANDEPSFLEFLNHLCREDRRNQNQEK